MPWRRGRGGRNYRVRLRGGKLVDSERERRGLKKLSRDREDTRLRFCIQLRSMYMEHGEASRGFAKNMKILLL